MSISIQPVHFEQIRKVALERTAIVLEPNQSYLALTLKDDTRKEDHELQHSTVRNQLGLG